MKTLRDHLRTLPEPIPEWLVKFSAGDEIGLAQFLSSRIVYYPGSRHDGQPTDLFASTHNAHAFVYVDYQKSKESILTYLRDPRRSCRGYFSLDRIYLSEIFGAYRDTEGTYVPKSVFL